MEWLQENWLVVLSVAIVVIAVTVVLLIGKAQQKRLGEQRSTTRDITFGAICIAAAFALSFFGYELPQGGRITPASVLPVMLYCHYCGVKKGTIVCVAFTLLQFMQNPYIFTPVQVILDYFLPYLALIFTAIIPFDRNKHDALINDGKSAASSHYGFYIGSGIYTVTRYISHVLSGAIFFAEYAWAGWSAWPYSIVYNLFAIIDAAIAVGVGAALFSNKAVDTAMAKSFNAVKNSNACAEND